MIRDLFFVAVGVVVAVCVPKVYAGGQKFVAWVKGKWADRNKLRIP